MSEAKAEFTGTWAGLRTSLDTFEIKGVFDADFTDLLRDVSFQGYDPMKFYEVLVGIAQKQAIRPDMFKADMLFLVTFGVARSIRVDRERITSRTAEEGARRVKELITRYTIQSGKQPRKSTDVTIPRIIGAFPQIGAAVMSEPGARIVGDRIIGLPKGLHFPAGASFVAADAGNLWAAFRLHVKSFSITINNGNDDLVETNVAYAVITRNSRMIDDAKRKAAVNAMITKEIKSGSTPGFIIFAMIYTVPGDWIDEKNGLPDAGSEADVGTVQTALNGVWDSLNGRQRTIARRLWRKMGAEGQEAFNEYKASLAGAPEPAAQALPSAPAQRA